MKTIPEVIVSSKQRIPLKNYIGTIIGYLVGKKEKDKVWKEFGVIPNMENYQNALNKQNE